MAGHSKWANIKHRKGKADALKGKLFSRAAKEIISAVKQGGPDPKSNARLRLAVQKARAANVPNENIERNIKKGASSEQADYVAFTYEFYGYGGVGIIVEGMTDNKNRTASDMRIATNKKGGTIAAPGSVMFNFERKGVIHIPKTRVVEDELFLPGASAGAEDFSSEEDAYILITPPEILMQVKESLDQQGFLCDQADLELIPKIEVSCDPTTQQVFLFHHHL